jgi:hypothetical protein
MKPTTGSHTRPAATPRATPIHAAGTAIEGPRPSSPGRPIHTKETGVMAIDEDILIDFDDVVTVVSADLLAGVPRERLIAHVQTYGEYADVEQFTTARLARIIATHIAEAALEDDRETA